MRHEHAGHVEPRSIVGWRLALALALVACLPASLPAAANAAAGVTVAPAFPANVTIGQTGVSGEIVVTNSNTSPEVASTICDAGDTGLCLGSPGITLIPSCSATDFQSDCTPAGADPNVFALSSTAVGTSGSACDGETFTVTTIDAVYGKVRFTPTSGNVVLPGPTAACRIQFTFSVLKSPADARPLVNGRQTLQIVESTVRTDQDTGDFDRAFGSPVTVKLAAPVIAESNPPSPANHTAPQLTGTAPAGTTLVSIYTNASCSGSPVVQGAPATFAAAGLAVSVGDDSSTTFYAQGTDGDGGTSNCSPGFTYVEDSTPPSAPTLDDTDPESPGNDNAPRITGSAPAGSTVRIYKTADCTGPVAAQGSAAAFASPGLSAPVADDSTTTFRATATDAAGNVSSCSSSSIVYVEDSIAPSSPTTASSDPASPSNDDTPRIVGSAPAGTTVTLYTNPTCAGSPAGSGSAAAYASPGIQVVVASNSTTTFYATATDAAGNASPCSATGTVYVEDSVAPSAPALVGTAPGSPSTDNTPRVKGTAPADTTVRLYTDAACGGAVAGEGSAAAFAAPGIAVSVADNSTTTFRAKATDAAGNASGCSPTAVVYTEDSAAPETVLDSVPSGTGAATFTFSSSEPGVRFECRIDLGEFVPCSSPYTTGALPAGAHTFEVRAVDSAGNADPTSAGRTFTVAGTPVPPPAVTPPTTRAQPGCLNVKGALYVGTSAANIRNGGRGTDIMFGLGGNDALRGQAGLDCIYGGNGRDLLYGAAGNDRLFGGAGADRLDGQAGNDRVGGQSGNDRLYGGAGNDVLTGAAGRDQLVDRRGRDRLSGGAGSDRIDARDTTVAGRRVIDTITCGKGLDTVLADPRDRVARDCEKARVTRRSLGVAAPR